MKKTYITPVSDALELHTEQMLAASTILEMKDGDVEANDASLLSNNKIWGPKSIWEE